MDARYIIFIFFIQANYAYVSGQDESIRAYFNMSGVIGNVEFIANGAATRAILNLEVTKAWSSWEIREFPVVTTHDSYDCDDAILGNKLHNLSSYHTITGSVSNLSVELSGISLTSGDTAILGRSLLLDDGQKRACATIQGAEPVSFATVNGQIAGTIHVREVGSRYAVFTDLITTISLASRATVLKVYDGSVELDLPTAQRLTSADTSRCDNITGSTLITELQSVPVAAGDSHTRWLTYVSASNFDFSSGSVLIGETSDLSCANFHIFEPKTVAAKFSRKGVKGAVTFTQENPYKPTFVTVDLQGLDSKAAGYHVHLYPLPYEFSADTDLCGVTSTGGHFNPFQSGVVGLTQDVLEIGDLSTKHSSLAGKELINETYMDLYLPLFGKHSIVGRSLVIHYPDGGRWICANIRYPGPVIVAKAELNGDVHGTLTFVQRENMPWDDTSVFVEMTDAGSSSGPTNQHHYHIHSDPVGDDYMSADGRCASTGGHWNPFDVAVDDTSVYSSACPANRFACEIGDLSKKYGEAIDIPESPSISKYFYTDELPLSSAYSIIKKSVTVHQEYSAAGRYVCGDILQKLNPVVTTDVYWHNGPLNGTVEGSITMTSYDIPTAVSVVSVNMSGLDKKADEWHIHSLTLNTPQPGDNVCDTTSVHYNPLEAVDKVTGKTLDSYEIGDFSNKFVSMSGFDNFQIKVEDTNLPMSGAYSVMGRSLVIHDGAEARWRCTDINWDAEAMGGVLLKASAEFSGDIEGYMTFSQVVNSEGETDVNIEITLWYSDEQQAMTSNHNWHVHSLPVYDGCGSTGGHYNPFEINVSTKSYNSDCNVQTPKKCELGDMAGKLGRVNIGTKDSPARYVFNDHFLSLTGQFSIVGRSIVIHSEEAGPERIACADIVPFGDMTRVVEYEIPTPDSAFKSDFAVAVANNVGTDSENVYIGGDVSTDDCTTVQIHFTGLDAIDLSKRFEPKALEEVYYSPDVCDTTTAVTGQEVRAYFNMSGVQGFVEFTEEGTSSTSATIYVNVQQLYRWEIRELPILTTEGQTCDDAYLGQSIHTLGNYMNGIDANTVNGTRVPLNGVPLRVGDNAILGRTLLLYNGQGRACATIQGAEPVSFATVNGHIAGTIHVREIGSRYAVFTDLISTRSLQQSRTSLKIYDGHILSDLPHAQREVIEASDRCKNKNNRVSSINMVAEIRDVPIAPGDGMIRYIAYVEPNTREFDFSSGWVKVGEDPDTSCANFHQFERKTVTAMFSRDEVKGTITFTQENPYTPTFVTVDLLNLNRQADGYHVHVYPLPYEFTSNTDLCGVESTGGHLDPFNGITTGATQELAEIGDLSTKHGFLKDKLDVNETYMDLYLPLFGKNSIVGRSLVIHAPGGSRWICANIGYPGPVTVAKSEVNGEIQGTLTFVQRENMPWDDTSVFVEMTDAGAESEATYNHNYHIHSDPVGDDYMSAQGRCASTGEHWNPFDVAVKEKSVYNPACEINRFGCEIGDLSKKYNETVNMTSSKVSKYFYTDDLPLSSAYSIIKKSITVHKEFADAARYACADIVQKLTPVVTTETQWYGLEGTATGSIQMSSSGLIGSVTTLKVDLSGLDGKGDGYHIHEYPLNNRQPGSNVCGTTGGHYNPLGAIKWKNDDSFDNYEIGDLSNKFGMLNGLNSYRLQAQDSNLPLSGPYSSVGRSVVIHDSVNRWKCTNTVWDTVAMNGSLIQGYSKFTGDVQGHIQLLQVVTEDGESDVNIEMMLWHSNSDTETRNHNWHIHEYSIAGTDCSTAGLHYNPFDIDISTQTYKTDCDLETPRKCEVGDLAGKLGQINIGTKDNPTRYVFNDNFLSLTGKFAVLAKSLVIHAKDSGAARIACQDIMPTGQLTEMTQYYIETPLDKHKIKEGMTAAITDSMDIFDKHIVYVGVGEEKGICTTVSVYFTGEKATELKSKFNADDVDSYKPMDVDTCLSAAASAAPSLLLGLAALLFSFFTANIPH